MGAYIWMELLRMDHNFEEGNYYWYPDIFVDGAYICSIRIINYSSRIFSFIKEPHGFGFISIASIFIVIMIKENIVSVSDGNGGVLLNLFCSYYKCTQTYCKHQDSI